MSEFLVGDRVTRGSLEATVIAVDDDLAWIRYLGGEQEVIKGREQAVVKVSNLEPIPAHPIPSEPNTAWVDSEGDVALVTDDGELITKWAESYSSPESYVPFTRLVREGSEREAAIREVVQWLEDQELGTYAKWVREHFLSGVEQ